MSSIFFLDEIEITPVTQDSTFGNTSEEVKRITKGYMEDDDFIARSSDGTPIGPRRMAFFPKGTKINEGDFVTLKKRSGKTVTDTDAVRREITKVFKARGIGESHVEVHTKSSGR